MVLAERTEFLTILYFCDARASFDGRNMVWTKRKKKKGRISVHSWPDQRQRISSSICCAVCVSSHRHSFFDCGFKMPFLGGNRAEWGGGAECAEGSCRNSAHMRIRDSFCNSLPLSRQRMYLSNHLNYYNHCWNGNARISSLTLRNFRGPGSTHRWVSVSLQNRIMLCEMSLPKKKLKKKKKLMEPNQNQRSDTTRL